MKVSKVTASHEIKNPNGRSVILDIHAVDANSNHYDIEIQRADIGASVKRARFNSSMLDTEILNKGDNYKKLPDSYVIFITENDIFKENRPLYVFERTEKETNKPLNDGSHIIYVNGAYQDTLTPSRRLIHDFRCTKAFDMYYYELKEKMKYFKEVKGGNDEMCKIFDEIKQEGRQEGIEQGIQQGMQESRIESAKTLLLNSDLSIKKIADCIKLPLDLVKCLVEEIRK